MFKNKLFNMALIFIIAITLLGVTTVLLWRFVMEPKNGEKAGRTEQVAALTADEREQYSVDTGEITANLLTRNFIIVRFTVITDSKKAKDELTKRLPQVNQIINKTMADLSPDDLKGSAGINKLEATIMNHISAIMQEGKIVEVNTTKIVLN